MCLLGGRAVSLQLAPEASIICLTWLGLAWLGLAWLGLACCCLARLVLELTVCTKNSIHTNESPNVGDDDRAVLPLPDPVRFAIQVEEPT
jgi:hypothetical protein